MNISFFIQSEEGVQQQQFLFAANLSAIMLKYSFNLDSKGKCFFVTMFYNTEKK